MTREKAPAMTDGPLPIDKQLQIPYHIFWLFWEIYKMTK
jgi:hypothetical protein